MDQDDAQKESDRLSDHKLAERLLQGTGISLTQAARLALETIEDALPHQGERHQPVSLCRHILRLGLQTYKKEQQTIPFYALTETLLQSNPRRRNRSFNEIRQIFHRIATVVPSLLSAPVRSITHEMCRTALEQTFSTIPMRRKALRILNSAFSLAQRRNWCDSNPAKLICIPADPEQHIPVLTIRQIRSLLKTLLAGEHRPCAPAVSMMLWAGIRPHEVERLRWQHVHYDDMVITIPAAHSKTGGARHVTLHPVLLQWLRICGTYQLPNQPIVPLSWTKRWRQVRQDAGLVPWHEDTLRHTFASYHAKHFMDFNQLQIEMGHASSSLLRTRYLSMQGLTKKSADEFWGNIIEKVLPTSRKTPNSPQ